MFDVRCKMVGRTHRGPFVETLSLGYPDSLNGSFESSLWGVRDYPFESFG